MEKIKFTFRKYPKSPTKGTIQVTEYLGDKKYKSYPTVQDFDENYWNPRTKNIRLNTPDFEDIKNRLENKKAEILRKNISKNGLPVKIHKLDFVNFCTRKIALINSAGTKIKYEDILTKFKKFLESEDIKSINIDKIDSNFAKRLQNYFYDSGLKNPCRDYIKVLQGFYIKACEDFELLLKNPFKQLHFKKWTIIKESLELDDILNMIAYENPKDESNSLFLFQFFCQGLRCSDAIKMRFSNIKKANKHSRLVNNEIETTHYEEYYFEFNMKKGNKTMKIFINNNLLFILKNQIRKQFGHIDFVDRYLNGNKYFIKQYETELNIDFQVEKYKRFDENIKKVMSNEILNNRQLVAEEMFYWNLIEAVILKDKRKNNFIFSYLDNEEFDGVKDFNNISKELYLNINKKIILINRQLKVVAKDLGIQSNLSSHIARHTFAKLALMTDAAVIDIKDMLGQSSIAITENYLQGITKNTSKEFGERMDLVFKKKKSEVNE